MALILNKDKIRNFRDRIKQLGGEDVSRCYQCGKCTAGCPVAVYMDIKPNQVMRLAQIGGDERVLSSSTIWLCLSCQVCSTRCPAGIDIAGAMDTLRKISVEDKHSSPENSIVKFHKAFLNSVKRSGRLQELEFSVMYNLALLKPLKNMDLAIKLFQKGKIKPFGVSTKDKGNIRNIFRNSRRFIKEKK